MKRFACQDVIPGCDQVFTGADDQSVLDQVIAHAAMDHGLVKPPMSLVELVVATTHSFVPQRARGHLRLVGAGAGDDGAVLGRSDDGIGNLEGQFGVASTTPTLAAEDPPAVATLAAARLRRSGAAATTPDGGAGPRTTARRPHIGMNASSTTASTSSSRWWSRSSGPVSSWTSQ